MTEELQQLSDVTAASTPAVVSGLLDWETVDLPTEDELGVEDDKPVESTKHRKQSNLMMQWLERVFRDRAGVCIAGDLAVYYQQGHSPVVPDVMVVFGVEVRERKAYLVWKEGKGPDWVLELLSASTAEKDRETNYGIYEQRVRVPEYVWFNPDDPKELRAFRLRGGRYEEMAADERGWLWSEELRLYLGVHEGWLRLYDAEGNLVLSGDEHAQREQAAREAAEEQARLAQQRAEAAGEEAAQERAARAEAEAELARLREELARLKA
jgi:Uma2 family endonuclease